MPLFTSFTQLSQLIIHIGIAVIILVENLVSNFFLIQFKYSGFGVLACSGWEWILTWIEGFMHVA